MKKLLCVLSLFCFFFSTYAQNECTIIIEDNPYVSGGIKHFYTNCTHSIKFAITNSDGCKIDMKDIQLQSSDVVEMKQRPNRLYSVVTNATSAFIKIEAYKEGALIASNNFRVHRIPAPAIKFSQRSAISGGRPVDISIPFRIKLIPDKLFQGGLAREAKYNVKAVRVLLIRSGEKIEELNVENKDEISLDIWASKIQKGDIVQFYIRDVTRTTARGVKESVYFPVKNVYNFFTR